MPQVKESFFENILFKFETCSCDCVEDIEHIAPDTEPISKFKLQALPNKPLLFGYAAKDGLVRIATNGTISERNILGTLIALANKPKKELITFLKENGSLFPISDEKYEPFSENKIYGIINRLKATIELMTASSEIKKDYQKICDLTIQLLLAEEFSINTSVMKTPYHSCHHSYIDLIKNPPSQISDEHNQDNFDGETYFIKDSIYGTYKLDISEYYEIEGGYSRIPGYDPVFYINLTAAFLNLNTDDMLKKITDFLFHYLHDMVQPQKMNFSDKMKAALLEIAKFVIGEEINANLNGIHPIYNSKSMSPSWKVDSLLCAAYFSIFYLKPDLELYRPCDNPRCGKYFLVKTTSTRNRFCSKECCNRVTQDRYRKRKREKDSK